MSETPVEILYGGKYVAHAGRLNIDIPGEVYTLQGERASTASRGCSRRSRSPRSG